MVNNYYKHKSVAILGLGVSGIATYNFFVSKGYKVVAFDDNKETAQKHFNNGLNIVSYQQWNFNSLDCIITSPGISLYYPQNHPLINLIQQHNSQVNIICDIDVLIQFNPTIKYIAITGTNGKSTTTSLLQHILSSNNLKSILLGNIGVPALSVNANNYDYIILELSSYQLEILNKYSFFIAAILNIKEDHLDYHGNFNNYVNAKLKIFYNQPSNGLALIDNSLMQYYNKILIDNICIIDTVKNTIKIQSNYLNGEHNLQNIMFCYYISKFLGITEHNILNAISSFKGLPHRQQIVTTFNNVTFVNDSKATNPESTEVALKSFSNSVLILGGIHKRNDIDILIPYLTTSIKYIVLIGSSSSLYAKILNTYNIKYSIANTLPDAVNTAYLYCINNKLNILNSCYVLFSPACASFDMFKNYEHRGYEFINCVHNLINNKQ